MGLLFIFGNVNYRKVMSLESIALILSIKNFIYRHPYFLLFLKIMILIKSLYLTLLWFNSTNYPFFIIPKQGQPLFQVYS